MPIFYLVVNKFIGNRQKDDFGETQPKVKHRYISEKSLWISVSLQRCREEFYQFFCE